MPESIRAWGTCIDCGYEGMLEYFQVAGEAYDDQDSLGVMMLLHCPACGSDEHTLITMEYFDEIRREAEDGGR